jgi:glucosamine--fructose-6-phosphate aminotransferase (isomerizing)
MRHADPGSQMRSEMAEQPERVTAALESASAAAGYLAKLVQGADSVVFLGRGSSRSAATYGVHALRTIAKKPAFQLSPAELGWGGSRPHLAGALVVAISQSGASPEVLAAAECARSQGSHLLVITNSTDSPLAGLASDERSILNCHAGVERAVPATKSFTSTLACLLALAVADRPDHLLAARDQLPGLMREVHDDPEAGFDISELAGFVMVGEGFAESVAEEGAIKVRETLRTLVASLEASEFLHGSVNSVGRGNGVVAIGADPLGTHLAEQVTSEAARRGATTVYVGPGRRSQADHRIFLPDVRPEWTPFLGILPIQRAAYAGALAAGLDPDAPHGLNKITRISELHETPTLEADCDKS